jgi:2-polyprenyl-3-methyl-5-hydroxy-6-metoxy-1,4-benzoquinol methylase
MSTKFIKNRARQAFNLLVRTDEKYRAVAPYLGQCVLDLGCGWGGVIPLLSGGVRYVGIDVNPEIINFLRSRYPQYQFYRLNLNKDPLPDLAAYKPFSSIVMLAVIEHLPNPDFVLDQCRNLMDEATLLIIDTPTQLGDLVCQTFERLFGNPKAPDAYPHVRIYSRYDLDSLCKAHGLFPRHYEKLRWHRQDQLSIYTKA